MDLVSSYRSMAEMYRDQGKLVEALELLQRCVEINIRLDPFSLANATGYDYIAAMYKDQGKLAEAAELLKKSENLRNAIQLKTVFNGFQRHRRESCEGCCVMQ